MGKHLSVDHFGARPDCIEFSDGAMTSGSAVFTKPSGGFTTADTGKTFVVVGALGALVNPLIATGTYLSATTMTLSVTATATVSGAFGAFGTNNSAFINDALSNCRVRNHGSLLIPSGMYLVGGATLDVLSEIDIYGMGRSSLFYAASFTDSGFHANGRSRVSYRNLAFKSHAVVRSTLSTTAAIWNENCGQVACENIYIDGGASAGIINDGCASVHVKSVEVRNTKADGVHTVGGCDQVLVDGVLAYNTGDDAVSVVSYASQPLTKFTSVSNVIAVDCKARGVSAIGSQNVMISNCQVKNPGSHGLIVAYEVAFSTRTPSKVNISHCRVEEVDAAPGFNAVLVLGDATHIVNDVTVSNCTIVASNQSLIQYASNVRWIDNEIRDGIYNGLLVKNCTDVDIEGSKFKNIQESGLALDAVVDGKIENNRFHECQATVANASAGRINIVNSTDVYGGGNRDKRAAAVASYGPLLSSGNTRVNVGVTEIDIDATDTNYRLKGIEYNSATRQLFIETNRPVNDAEYGVVSEKGAYFHAGDVQIEGTGKKLLGSGGAASLSLGSGFPRLSSPGSIALEMNTDGAGTGETVAIKNNGTIILNVTQAGDMFAGGKLYLGNLSTTFFFAGSGSPNGVLVASPGSVYLDKDGSLDLMLWLKISGAGNTGWASVPLSSEIPATGSAGMFLQLTNTSPKTVQFQKVDMGVATNVKFTGGVTDRPVKKGVNGELWTDTINLQNANEVRHTFADGVVLAASGGVVSYYTLTGLASNIQGLLDIHAIPGFDTIIADLQSQIDGKANSIHGHTGTTGGASAGTAHTHGVTL